MVNLKLEELRTKEELIKYFKQLGKNITEEEIETLKKQFEPYAKDESTLTMQQLSEVAGGYLFLHISAEKLSVELQKKLLGFTSEKFTVFEHKGINEEKQTVEQLVIGYNDGENRVVRVEGDNFVSIEKNQIQITLSDGTTRNITTMNKNTLEGGLSGLSGTKFEGYNQAFLLHKGGAFFEESKSADLEYARSVLESMQTHSKLNATDFDKKISEIPGLKQLREGLQSTETPVPAAHSTDSNSPKKKVESTPQALVVRKIKHKSRLSYFPQPNPDGTPNKLNYSSDPSLLPPGFELAQRPINSPDPSSTVASLSPAPQPKQDGHPNKEGAGDSTLGAPPLPTVPAPDLQQDGLQANLGIPNPLPSVIPTPTSSPEPTPPLDPEDSAQAAQQFGIDKSQTSPQPKNADDTSYSAQPGATGQISSEPSYMPDVKRKKDEFEKSGGVSGNTQLQSSSDVEEQEQPLIQDKEQGNNGKKETQKQKELEKKCNKIVNLSIGAFSYIAFVVTALCIFAELDPNDFDKYITKNISEIFNKIFEKDKNGKKVK